MSDAAAQAAVPAPIALLGTLLTIGGDANSALSVARPLKRNLPLVVLSFDRCVVLAKKAARFPEEDDDVASRPNGAQQFGQRDGALAHPAAAVRRPRRPCHLRGDGRQRSHPRLPRALARGQVQAAGRASAPRLVADRAQYQICRRRSDVVTKSELASRWQYPSCANASACRRITCSAFKATLP